MNLTESLLLKEESVLLALIGQSDSGDKPPYKQSPEASLSITADRRHRQWEPSLGPQTTLAVDHGSAISPTPRPLLKLLD